jgi:hypothetical protein
MTDPTNVDPGEDSGEDTNPFSAPEIEKPDVRIDEPINLRPDLSLLGIQESDRGVCEDTYENRAILRRSKLNWAPVYATNGVPTGLIQAISSEMLTERRVLSLAEKKPLLTDPSNKNSDYLIGYDLIAEESTDYLVPPWVIGATRSWIKEQTEPVKSSKRKPAALPHRCNAIKDDGIRCQLWSSGRLTDDGLCRIHLGSLKRRPGDDIERARAKLTQAAPYAVDVLEDMMSNAESEPVKLKAATEILDRAGVRGGVELDANVNLDVRPAASIIAERLNRLAVNAMSNAASLAATGVTVEVETDVRDDIVDAEIVESEENDNNTNEVKE